MKLGGKSKKYGISKRIQSIEKFKLGWILDSLSRRRLNLYVLFGHSYRVLPVRIRVGGPMDQAKCR